MNHGRFRNDALLVGTEWLADRLGDADLRIVEVTPPGSGYIFGHIPGAVYLSLDDVFTGGVTGVRRSLGPIPEVVDTLGRLGLSPDRHVVVYDAIGGSEAAQVFWLLEYLGFDRVSVLEGGVRAAHARRGAPRRGTRAGSQLDAPRGVPGDGAVPVDARAGQRDVRSVRAAHRRPPRRARRGPAPARAGRAEGLRTPLSGRALRRHAAPGRAGPRDDQRPPGHADGRAVPGASVR